jgi:hypothetical protein
MIKNMHRMPSDAIGGKLPATTPCHGVFYTRIRLSLMQLRSTASLAGGIMLIISDHDVCQHKNRSSRFCRTK